MNTERVETSTTTGTPKRRWRWLLLGALSAAAVAVFAYRVGQEPPPAPEPTPGPEAITTAPPQALPAPEAPSAAMPPVEEADAQVRERLEGVSPAALWAKWLQANDLARRFVSASNSVADGDSPRQSVSFLAPQGPFKVVKGKRGKTYIAPESYRRYDAIADTFASIDPQAAGKAYGALRPMLEAAYREIGRPGTTLDQRLSAAFARLLSTPVPEGPVEVVSPQVLWLYADPALEGLPAASKHLLRMGSRNQKLVQGKLGELREALGLPAPTAAAARRPGPPR